MAQKNSLKVNIGQQYRTVDELIEKSRPSAIYYTLLVLSAFIVASGLILDNPAIVIGGMLVTPMLTPILFIALGLAIGELNPIKNAVLLVAKSSILVIFAALVLALIFGSKESTFVFEDTAKTAVLYFIVAIASGVAATLAWTRKEIADVLPGVAIAVSLVPPLALVGIGMSFWDIDIVRFHALIYLFNLLGIIVGSLVVFTLLKFYRAVREVERKSKE